MRRTDGKNRIDFGKITIRVPRVLQKKAMLVSETDVELLSNGTESLRLKIFKAKKESRKFQKAKLEFATCWQLLT